MKLFIASALLLLVNLNFCTTTNSSSSSSYVVKSRKFSKNLTTFTDSRNSSSSNGKGSNDDVLLAGVVLASSLSSPVTNDEHATDVNRFRRHTNSNAAYLPASNPSSSHYFRDLISRGDGQQQNMVEYTANPSSSSSSHSGYFLPKPQQQQHRKQQSPDVHHVRYTREVHVRQGRLKGIVRELNTQSDLRLQSVDQFLGIPYAEAPVGSRRFMPPSSPLLWHDLKYAIKHASVCPQKLPNLSDPAGYNSGRYDQIKRLLPYLKNESEDCLYLNLYVTSWGE